MSRWKAVSRMANGLKVLGAPLDLVEGYAYGQVVRTPMSMEALTL